MERDEETSTGGRRKEVGRWSRIGRGGRKEGLKD